MTVTRRVGWGVLDQGISSLSNFVLGILVARTLPAAEFGAFALAFVTFAFIISASRGPSTDPLMARFSRASPEQWRAAAGAAAGTALSVGVLAGVVCLLVGLVIGGVCRVPGLMEALIPRKDESHGSTEEVPRRTSGASDPDGSRSTP